MQKPADMRPKDREGAQALAAWKKFQARREPIATAALTALLQNPATPTHSLIPEKTAGMAVAYADALLEALDK